MERMQEGEDQNGKDHIVHTNGKALEFEEVEFKSAKGKGGEETQPLLEEGGDGLQSSEEFLAVRKAALSKLQSAFGGGSERTLPSFSLPSSFTLPAHLSPYVVPVLAILNWWIFNVATIIGNKIIYETYGFRFPLVLTTIHFFISSLGAYISLKILQLRPLVEIKGMDLIYRLGPMATATCLNIVLGNVSLKYIPVTFMQTIKAFTPATTVFLQRLVWGKRFDYRLYIALVPVSGGICLASASELSFHLVGFLCAFVSCFVTSITTIMAEVLLQGKYELDSLNAVYYMAPQATILLLPFALFFEFRETYIWFLTSPDRYVALAAIAASGSAAFFLNFALFMAVKATSAVTFNVAGNLKVTCAIIIGWLIFQNPMSQWSSLGCALTLGGCTVYGYIQHMVKVEQQMKYSKSSFKLSDTVVQQLSNSSPLPRSSPSPKASPRNANAIKDFHEEEV